MTTRAEVERTDNSKLGRAVLNNKQLNNKQPETVSVAPAPKPVVIVKKSSVEKKITKKS
tara:strand:- start:854 stop:1030 length:177 start_codon:yes stop_codon:yes gene_type:complete